MSRRAQGERGVTLAMVAVMLFGFMVMTALAFDLGILYSARTSAQHAADAAALAGAYTFLNPAAPQPTAAINAAIAVAAENKILGTTVAISASNVSVDIANRRVTVNVPRTGANGIPVYFARITGQQRADVLVTATAEASESAGGSRCVKPLYLPNTVISPNTADTACTNGETLFDGSGNVTAYAETRMGQQINVRPADPSFALAPGQFYSLDFGSGASTYECTLEKCLNQCSGVSDDLVECGESYPLKTGNMVGPTRQGIDGLIGTNPDTWLAIGEYQDAGGVVWDTSRSLVITPVWDNCAQTISPGYAGQQVMVIGFADVFIDGMRGQMVYGHLAGATGCGGRGGSGGGSGGSPYGAGTGPMATPVRLVNP